MVKNKTRSRTLAVLGLAIALTLLGVPAFPPGALQTAHAAAPESSVDGLPGAQFVHVATPESINGHWSVFSHPLTDGNPNAVVFVTPNWNPGDLPGTYNNHPIGVYYVPGIDRWAVLNEDFGAIAVGAAFNVLVPKVDSSVFVHTATSGNTSGNSTYIDNPLTNGKPNAVLHVTQNWNPGGGGGTYNNHEIGVWYSIVASKWAIYNQDLVNMPLGADFNVQVVSAGPTAFSHEATAENVNGNWTALNHPAANGNPNAIVHITQNYNPGGGGGVYNDHAVGVWYNADIGRWAVFNQDLASMPQGAAFNIVVTGAPIASFVHTATDANTTAHWTAIDHPLTNNNPHAIVLVTQAWNPGGGGGVYNDHPIGVYWVTGTNRWAIFNQDFGAMPEGARFNVVVPSGSFHAFVHTATADNIVASWTYIDHPLANGNPQAILLATANWNPGGSGGQYNNHEIGVWYDTDVSRWAVFNQDLGSMVEGLDFNILIPATGPTAFVHEAATGNTYGNSTALEHPLTSNRPYAIVLATQNYNPGGGPGIYNDHATGVWYDGSRARWSVFNQDLAAMPLGASFNVAVFGYRSYVTMSLRGY